MADRFPWFPFYAADWRLSNTVRAMTYEQRGVYLELLCIAWDDGRKAPSLSSDERELAALTGLGKRWAKVGPTILASCFSLEEGRYYNIRLTAVWEVQRAKYEIRSETGRLGGIAKAKRLAKDKEAPSNASRLPAGSHTNARAFAGQTQKSDRTKSSSGATLASAVLDALASLGRNRP